MNEPTPARPSKYVWIALALVMLLGTWLRVYDLGGPCFDQDELYAVRITGLSPKTFASVVARDGLKTNHPPLMTVPFLFWTALFGTSETAVRALPCLAGILTLFVVFRLGWVLVNPRVGVIAAAALAINPLHITYSQEARQYSLLVLLVALSHLLMLKCITRGKWYDLLGYLVISSLALLTHYFAAPALFAHLAIAMSWMVLNKDTTTRAVGLRVIATLGLAGLCLAAWLPMAQYQSTMKWGHLSEVSVVGLGEANAQLAGVGWPGAWGLLAGVLTAWFMVYGLYTGLSQPVAPPHSDGRAPLPRWFGILALFGGVLGVIGTLTIAPRVLLPMARKSLEAYQYDAATIDIELGVIQRTLLGYSIALGLFGILLVVWRPISDRLVIRLGRVALFSRAVPAGGVVAAWILVPFIVVALAAVLGIPVFSVRNMIVVGPAVAVALGMTAEALWQRSWSGQAVLALLAGLLVGGATYSEVVTAPFGVPGGPRLGMDTPDWKTAAKELPPELPVVVVNHPTTDPLLYYAADRSPLRVKPEGPFEGLPAKFAFIHWRSRADSTELLRAFLKRGYSVKDEKDLPEVTVMVLSKN